MFDYVSGYPHEPTSFPGGKRPWERGCELLRFLILRLSFRSCQFFIFFNFSPICGVYPSAAIFVSCENDGLCFRVLSVFLVKNICINSEKCIGYGKQRTTTTPEACMCYASAAHRMTGICGCYAHACHVSQLTG